MNLVPKSRGYNPLHCALLAAGFMPKNADVMVETLLECGADPNRMTNCGTHPLELAKQSNHENCKDLLLFAGAVLSPLLLPPFPLCICHISTRCCSVPVFFYLTQAHLNSVARLLAFEVLEWCASGLHRAGCTGFAKAASTKSFASESRGTSSTRKTCASLRSFFFLFRQINPLFQKNACSWSLDSLRSRPAT